MANWTLRAGTRTQLGQEAGSVVASIAAACSDGTQLATVQAPTNSPNFTLQLGPPVVITTSTRANFTEGWNRPQDLGNVNADGFHAVWVV